VRRLRVDLAPPELGEGGGEGRREAAVGGEADERAARGAPGADRQEPLGERWEDRAAVAGRREDLRNDPIEGRDGRAEQDPALRVAQATRTPRRGERRRDDAEG
jgi:hypothetical protein